MMNLIDDCENKCEMSEMESKIFTSCILHELKNEDVPDKLKTHPCYLKFESLLEKHNVPCGQWPIMFITFITQHPAKLTMFAYAFYLISKKVGREVQMQDFSDFFPMGFPSEFEYRMVWESQKDPDCQNSNFLDTEGAWQL